jgi:hypothetical protein
VFGTRLAKEASLSFPPGGGRLGWGGDAGPLGSADAHPHPALPRRGGGTSAAPDDNICAEQYWGEGESARPTTCCTQHTFPY